MTKGLVVVLGKAGKNFAAGMSGGLAFVLDQTGEFSATLCNKSMVDLEPVIEQTDIQALRNLIQRHAELTESPRARWILANFDTMLPKFVKVFPRDFKRVIEARKHAAAQPAERAPSASVPV